MVCLQVAEEVDKASGAAEEIHEEEVGGTRRGGRQAEGQWELCSLCYGMTLVLRDAPYLVVVLLLYLKFKATLSWPAA